MCGRRSRRNSGCGKRSHFRCAGCYQYAGARFQRRPRRAHVVHQHDTKTRDPSATGESECVADVAQPGVCGEIGLGARVPVANERAADRDLEVSGKVECLVETPPPPPAPVQRHRHDAVGTCEDIRAAHPHQPAERRGKRSPPVVLECLQDRAQRPLIDPYRAPRCDVGSLHPAVGTRRGRHSPGQQRIAAHRAERRWNRPYCLPAVVAHDAQAGSRERTLAGSADRSQQDRQKAVGQQPEGCQGCFCERRGSRGHVRPSARAVPAWWGGKTGWKPAVERSCAGSPGRFLVPSGGRTWQKAIATGRRRPAPDP